MALKKKVVVVVVVGTRDPNVFGIGELVLSVLAYMMEINQT